MRPEDRESERAALERALLLGHGRGLPLAVHLRSRPGGTDEISLGVPWQGVRWINETLGGRSGRTLLRPTNPPSFGPIREEDLVGDVVLAKGSDRLSPQRSERPGGGPWEELCRIRHGSAMDLEVLWRGEPIGPSGSVRLPPLGNRPRGDRETPVPVPVSTPLRRSLESAWEEHNLGPWWEVSARVRVVGGRRTPRGPSPAVLVRRWFEVISDLKGGGGLTIRWRRGLLFGRGSLSTPPRPLPWRTRTPVLCPTELLAWLSVDLPPRDVLGAAGREAELTLQGVHFEGMEGWPWNPGEGHHLLIVGETGMGKSSFLTSLAAATFERPRVETVVIDPLGDTVREFLRRVTPGGERRARLWAPLSAPLPLDLFESPSAASASDLAQDQDRRVGELVSALRQLRSERYGETVFWGPRLEGLLRRVLLLVVRQPHGTLRDAETLLSAPELWSAQAERLPERSRELYRGILRESPEDRQGARRVIEEITLSEVLGKLLADPSPTPLASLLGPGRAVGFDLERARVGERISSYLGGVLLSLLWTYAMHRDRRHALALFLDEVQAYPSAVLLEMLALGRRFNLHLVAATQSLGSLSPALRDALLTNCRDWVLFRGSPADERYIENVAPSVSREWTGLAQGEALVLRGKGRHIARLRTLPPRPVTGERPGSSPVLGPAASGPDTADRSGARSPPELTHPAPASPESADPTGLFRSRLEEWRKGQPEGTVLLPLREVLLWFHGDAKEVRRIGALGFRTGLFRGRRETSEGPCWELREERGEGTAPAPFP